VQITKSVVGFFACCNFASLALTVAKEKTPKWNKGVSVMAKRITVSTQRTLARSTSTKSLKRSSTPNATTNHSLHYFEQKPKPTTLGSHWLVHGTSDVSQML
jgi:hypothetical protein